MVYIIDDDESVRRGLKYLLKSAGFECIAFEGAQKFLEFWRPGDYGILILDIHMPGMNGYDLMEHLIKRKLHLPVIILTAYDDPESIAISEKYGVLAYLRKPFDDEALIHSIKQAIHPV
jgi:FixJ family two-component response regulator